MKKLFKFSISDDNQIQIPASILYNFLQPDDSMTIWFKKILEYNYKYGEDYEEYPDDLIIPENSPIEFLLGSTMAKEVSLLNKSPKGRHARQYIIELEKHQQIDIYELIHDQIMYTEFNWTGKFNLEDFGYQTVLGYAATTGPSLSFLETGTMRKKAIELSKSLGVRVIEIDVHSISINLYPIKFLEKLFQKAFITFRKDWLEE